MTIRYLCDDKCHLICDPYSVAGLHAMVADLGIKRCWFHGGNWQHYDVPLNRRAEIEAKCTFVSTRVILAIIKRDTAPLLVGASA